jgi:hypothetical protein
MMKYLLNTDNLQIALTDIEVHVTKGNVTKVYPLIHEDVLMFSHVPVGTDFQAFCLSSDYLTEDTIEKVCSLLPLIELLESM